MNSLYNINEELNTILAEIEENGGEINEELESKLTIKQEELTEKLEIYKNAVQQWKADIEAIKCETKRLSDRKSVLSNRIDKLKEEMVYAVDRFGYKGKTNKYYELPDARIYTKDTPSVVIFDDKVKFIFDCLHTYIHNYGHSNINTEDFLNYLNDTTDFIGRDKYTIEDINSISINISKNYILSDFINNKSGLTEDIYKEDKIESDYNISLLTSKSEFKDALNKQDNNITIATIIHNTSIVIK